MQNTLDAALSTLRDIGPTVGFLAAILVFGHLCDEAGVFTFLGSVATRTSRRSGRRLLALVIALAAGVTVVLTLDATVVLLTPVVLVTAARMRVPAQSYALACVRLANSGSLLLPVSNLTNLLAFSVSGLSFGRFAALMLLPWIAVCVLEWALLRTTFRADVGVTTEAVSTQLHAPKYALAVLALTLVGFVATSAASVEPVWAALAGCALLLVPRVHGRSVRIRALVRAASPLFCLAVLALAVVVHEVLRHGLDDDIARLLPDGTGFLALLGIALLAALLANLVNNLPATLALMPIVAANPAHVLAVLLGVNIGPNAAYPGSLATLLWRRIVPAEARPGAGRFHLIGLTTVVPFIAIACLSLTAAIAVVGIG